MSILSDLFVPLGNQVSCLIMCDTTAEEAQSSGAALKESV